MTVEQKRLRKLLNQPIAPNRTHSYGASCLDYLLRSPNGTVITPDVLMFNWGLHNVGNNTLPGQAGPIAEYMPYLIKIVDQLLEFCVKPKCKLLFGITTPELCSAESDAVVQSNNKNAVALMKEKGIPMVDMHQAIINKCGAAPQTECFGEPNCFCPHCPANNGLGYSWLANSTIVPAIKALL